MIIIRLASNEERFKLVCKGHAGFDEPGKDIVCAAVTALCYALVESLPADKWRGGMYEGDIRIEVDCSQQSDERKAFEVIARGLKLIAESYPENIQLWEDKLPTRRQAQKIARMAR